ncbi:hypothetical protein [Marinicella sp. W31]|uniref:hypothetical protein n=1 Tax=Marinicella sp. W31 TaxID=3023713 RepID=UPI0037577BE9
MGLFDFPSVVLTPVDEFLSDYFSLGWRITFWSILTAIMSTIAFFLTAPLSRIASLKKMLKKAQRNLNQYDGDFDGLKPLAKKALSLSFKRLFLTLIPTLCAVLPLLVILLFLSNRFDYVKPTSGQAVDYHVSDSDNNSTSSEWRWFDTSNTAVMAHTGTLTWPSQPEHWVFQYKDKTVSHLPPVPVSFLHKPQWWNLLIANPAGYLDESVEIDHIQFSFTPLQIDYGWFSGTWALLFYPLYTLCSLGLFLFLNHRRKRLDNDRS